MPLIISSIWARAASAREPNIGMVEGVVFNNAEYWS